MKKTLFTLLLFFTLLLYADVFSYDFGEHRDIGDRAFTQFISQLIREGFFKDTTEAVDFFESYLNMKYSKTENSLYFLDLTHEPNEVTYGVLNGLSGDHEENPESVRDNLNYKYSILNQILFLHNKFMAEFQHESPNSEILSIDPSFAYLAVTDFSHFYDYGKSLRYHLEQLERSDLILLKSPSGIPEVFGRLKKITSLGKYVTLHTFAVYLAELAGKYYSSDTARSKAYFFYAFLYSAFADHFLEDCFASGHIVVNRSIFNAIINNKGLHDFYNKTGLQVMNLNGNIWKTYGDHNLNKPDENWRRLKDYADIKIITVTPKEQIVIDAVTLSLNEIWTGFYKFRNDTANNSYPVHILDLVPGQKERLQSFCLEHFAALKLIPVPFDSDLDEYKLNKKDLPTLKRVNSLIENRNFVRSRVANSFMLELGSLNTFSLSGTEDDVSLFGLRFNLSAQFYKYNDTRNKGGTFDNWFGLTGSFNMGYNRNWKPVMRQYKAGGYYNGDFWVSKRRYIGVFSYIEVGLQNKDDLNKAMFSPSLGLQLGPLLGLDDFSLPRWLWIPIQMIVLPLKLMINLNVVPGQMPAYNLFGEIDLIL